MYIYIYIYNDYNNGVTILSQLDLTGVGGGGVVGGRQGGLCEDHVPEVSSLCVVAPLPS